MFLTAPNFSEGRDPARIASLRAVLASRLQILDRHSDREHNRTVFTAAGEEEDLVRALPDAADLAAQTLDMHRHRGLHPRIGALDVAPVIWLRPEDEVLARETAGAVAEEIGRLGIPVFLYGALAASEEREERAYFRHGGLTELSERMASGDLRPDRGPAKPHSRAGAVLVTARPPLAAFNVELDSADPAIAREVAAGLRESGGGFPGVRAIGLPLESGRTQVSTNIHNPLQVTPGQVAEEVRRLAHPLGAAPVEAEIVGLVPRAALDGFPADIPIRDRDEARQTIEGRLG